MRKGRWALAATAAGVAIAVRRRFRSRERVDLFFEDGSMVSLAASSADAEPLIRPAREACAAARR